MARSTNSRRVVMISAALLACLLLVIYEYILPEKNAQNYLRDVQADARQAKTVFEKLAASYSDMDALMPDASPADRDKNKRAARSAIAKARQSLTALESANTQLQPYPLSGYFNTYRTARIARQHTKDFISRGKSALDACDSMLTQADTYTATLQSAQTVFETFNKTTDINIYAGQSDLMLSYAAQLRQHADALRNLHLSQAYDQSRTASIKALTDGGQGFHDLALALDPPIDEYIYSAVQKIETANTALDEANQATLYAQLATSRTIREIDDLVETADYLEN